VSICICFFVSFLVFFWFENTTNISDLIFDFCIFIDLCVLYLCDVITFDLILNFRVFYWSLCSLSWDVVTLWSDLWFLHFYWPLCSLSLGCGYPLILSLVFAFFIGLCVLYFWDVITLWSYPWFSRFLLIFVFFIFGMWLPFDLILDFRVFYWSLCSLSLKCYYSLILFLIFAFLLILMFLDKK
jgi:hypothetical protein